MTNAQKTNLWIAALVACKNTSFNVRVLVATDVAEHLGLRAQFDDNGFELCKKGRGGKTLIKTTSDFVTAA